MPERESVEALIRLTLQGRSEEALLAFYHEDVVVRENNDPPRIGRQAGIARARAAAAWTRAVHEVSAPTVLIEGDRVVIEWHAEWTLGNGVRVRIEELALQCWQGERIVFERFFYDPGPVRDGGFET